MLAVWTRASVAHRVHRKTQVVPPRKHLFSILVMAKTKAVYVYLVWPRSTIHLYAIKWSRGKPKNKCTYLKIAEPKLRKLRTHPTWSWDTFGCVVVPFEVVLQRSQILLMELVVKVILSLQMRAESFNSLHQARSMCGLHVFVNLLGDAVERTKLNFTLVSPALLVFDQNNFHTNMIQDTSLNSPHWDIFLGC